MERATEIVARAEPAGPDWMHRMGVEVTAREAHGASVRPF
jgi:hypothetical protein